MFGNTPRRSLAATKLAKWFAAVEDSAFKPLRVIAQTFFDNEKEILNFFDYWIVYCGGTAVANPPTLAGVEAPADATLTLSASAMTLQLASIPSSVSNLKLIIQASAPQSNGVTRAYAKASAFANPYTPVSTAIDIKTAYDAKNGAPTTAAPKVFFKWFYVNTTTGEKSGEMMGYAKLAE